MVIGELGEDVERRSTQNTWGTKVYIAVPIAMS